MAIPRFYCPDRLLLEQGGELPAEVARHALRVLRLKKGDEIVVFDGAGGEFRSRVGIAERDRAWIEPGVHEAVERESPLHIVLVQSLCASDKMDWIVQKAVELGVGSIVVASMARSVVQLSPERRDRRLEHWRQVMVSAMEQCGRNRMPSLGFLSRLPDMEGYLPKQGLRCLLAPDGSGSWHGLSLPDKTVTVMVGPEGGFTEEEEQCAIRLGFLALRAGPRIMRTETAGLAVLAALQFGFGDWRG